MHPTPSGNYRSPALFALLFAGSAAVVNQGGAARTFDRVLLLESTSETSASVSIGDVDGNRTLDVVLAKGRHWPLNDVIMRNDGKGNFSAEPLADAPDRTYSAAMADLDGDTDLDIVVSNDKPDRKLIYLNDGKGRFQASGTFGDPEWNTRCSLLGSSSLARIGQDASRSIAAEATLQSQERRLIPAI